MATDVWGIALIKDEIDIVEQTVGALLRQVDEVLVADNGSTDGTREALEELGARVVDDPEPGFFQSRKMSDLAAQARELGAEWVVPFDADEVWLAKNGTVASTLRALPDEALIAESMLFDHVVTGCDPPGSPVDSIEWRRSAPAPLRKVACRAREGLTILQGNHAAVFEGIEHPLAVTGELEIRHFPYRSPEQFAKKVRNGAAAYEASDLPEELGAHWRAYGRILVEHGEEGLEEVFQRWFYRERPEEPIEIEGERQPPLVRDPCPLAG